MVDPIELTERDIIRRPAELATVPGAEPSGKGPLSWIKDVKENIKAVKEMMDTLKELGIELPALGKAAQPMNSAQSSSQGQMQQVQFFLQAIKAQYGDLTIKQLMAVLLDKYGEKKLGDLIK